MSPVKLMYNIKQRIDAQMEQGNGKPKTDVNASTQNERNR